jgi:hypothetical protein
MTLRELYNKTPLELKKILFNQWQAKQNPKWHPEGNTLKHIIVVTKRAIDKFPNDIDLILSAYFHDLGKWIHMKFHLNRVNQQLMGMKKCLLIWWMNFLRGLNPWVVI